MKTSRTLGMTVLCAILSAGTLHAAEMGNPPAGRPDARPGPAILKILSRLNVTPEQKSAIANVIKEYRDGNRAAIDQVLEARKELFARIHDDPIDEASIRGASRLLSLREEELAVRRARTVAALKSVLTPDQLETFRELRTKISDHIEIGKRCLFARIDAWVDANEAAN